MEFYATYFSNNQNQNYLKNNKIVAQTWTEEDIIEAVNQCNDVKALGED